MANFDYLANLAAIRDLGTSVKEDITRVENKIPTTVSALENDKNYATTTDVETAVSSQIGRVYRAGGSKPFAELPAPSAETLGMIYNITDNFTTTSDFAEGAGKYYSAGTDIGVVQEGETYKYNVFANFVDTENLVKKSGDKVLTDNNFSDQDVAKLNGVAEGATKVEASANEGNIKINGVETPVVNIASEQDVAEVINGIFGTPAAE